MKFIAKEVLNSELYASAEIFIENLGLLGGTRLLCEQGSVSDLNNDGGWLHQKICLELDRISSLKTSAIESVNDVYFDKSSLLDGMESNRGNRTFDEFYAEHLPPLLKLLGINFEQIVAEERNGDCLKKIHEKTKCLAVYFDEGPDFSHTYLIVKDPLDRVWQVGDGYIEGPFEDWGDLS